MSLLDSPARTGSCTIFASFRHLRSADAVPHSLKRRQVQCLCAALMLLTMMFPFLALAQSIDPRSVPSGSSQNRGSSQYDPNGDTRGSTTYDDDPGSTTSRQSTQGDTIAPEQIEQTRLRSEDNRGSSRDGEPRNRTATGNERIKQPAAPGEFERYLSQLTGRDIKRFGAELLVPSNRDFAVPAASTIPPDYAINIGDTIAINLVGSITGSAEFVVDRNGRVFLPNVGEISVIGVRYRDLRERIADAIGRKYRGYEVSVNLVALRGVRVYVTGFANNPGAYTVNSLSTLVNAVLAAGGPSAGGSFRHVQLFRNGRLVTDFDLYALIRGGDRSGDPLLQNEDVLNIPPVGDQIAVVGSVNEEAIYEARRGETIEQMLRYAGGPTALADPNRLYLYGLEDKASVGSREVLRDTAATRLATAGDIIQVVPLGSLSQPLERQAVLVRLEGEVNHPGNYYVAPSTPLSAVIEQAGGLTPRAYVYGTQMMRYSVLAQQREGFREAIDQLETTLAGAPLLNGGSIDSAERANQLAAARAVLERLRRAEPDGRLVLPVPYLAASLPGDILLENNDHIVVPPLQRVIGVFGSVYRPASFLLPNGTLLRVKDYLERAGGTTRTADRRHIFVVRANGEVLSHKHGALSARVQPGDVVFVPVKTASTSILTKLRDISTVLFQFGITAAAFAAVQ